MPVRQFRQRMSRIAQIVPKPNYAKIGSYASFEKMGMRPEEAMVFSIVDGLRNLRDLGERLDLPLDVICKCIEGLLHNRIILIDNAADRQVLLDFAAGRITEPSEEEIVPPENAGPVIPPAAAPGPVPEARIREAPPVPVETQPTDDPRKPDPSIAFAVGASETGAWDIDKLIDLFGQVHRGKQTARLRFHSNPDTYKSIYFKDGDIVTVVSSPFNAKECLGRLMQGAELISHDDVVESLRLTREKGGFQGERLVSMGKIRPEKLLELLRAQVAIKLGPVFEWEAGTYELTRLTKLSEKLPQMPMSLPRMLFALLWKHYPDSRIRKGIETEMDRWLGKRLDALYEYEVFSFGKQLMKFWEKILEKDIQLKRILVVSNLRQVETFKFIWLLYRLGLVEFLDDTREDKTEARIRVLAEALKHIEKETYFDIVRVHWTAHDAQIEEAFGKLKQEHEERIKDAGEIEKRLLEDLFRYGENAFEAIRTREKRQAYRKKIFDPSFIQVTAEIFRQKGESYLFTKEDFEQAIVELESSIEVMNPDGETLVILGLSNFLLGLQGNRSLAEKGRTQILRGHAMAMDSEITNIGTGMMHRKDGQGKTARNYYKKALEINPNSRFAKMEIRELETGERAADRGEVLEEFVEKRKTRTPPKGKKSPAR